MKKKSWVIMDIVDEKLKPYSHIHQLCRHSFTLESHIHPFWQLILVIDGELHIKTTSGVSILNAGDLHILPPNCEHSLMAPDQYTQLGLDLNAECSERELVPLLEQSFPKPCTISAEHFLTLATQISELQNIEIALSKARLVNLLDSLVITCLEIATSNSSPFKEQLASYLDANIHRSLRLSEIAEHFCISIAQLERRCHHYYNSSVIDLLQQRRIRKAQNFLINTELTVREVGCMVGYDEPTHFSNFFRKHTGISPRKYRTTQYF